MATRHIGLSLGADLCWPSFYEDIIGELAPAFDLDGESLSFSLERITIHPFSLEDPVKYDVILDRLTHWYQPSREWIKKAIVMDGTYVLNNPFTLQSMEKHTSYAAMMRLGLPVPTTWLLPPKEYDPYVDLQPTLDAYAKMFDLAEVGQKVGYPAYLKPYDGGAWVGVSRVENDEQLSAAYEASGTRVMHLQAAVEPFDLFLRSLAVGPQVNIMKYDPGAPIHDRYKVEFDVVNGEEWQQLSDLVLTINTFFGWDFNSCETLSKDGVFHPIDFANGCPDSQVTSLHYHLPWLVKAKIRWSLFCAATKRPMRLNPNWAPFFEIADSGLDTDEALAEYGRLARTILQAEEFESFCDEYLSELDEVALAYFGTDRARQIVRNKVAALFPPHEVDKFTDHFWGLIEFWRKTESDRLGKDS